MMNNYKVAVTGGIGSGKSTAVKIISDMGYPVFSADEISRKITEREDILVVLCVKFGKEIMEEGKLNRKKLAEVVFGDKFKLDELNKFLHPIIMEELNTKMKNCGGICVAEVPVLFEYGYEKTFDKVIIITRELKARVQAVVKRDNISLEQVIMRIKNQFNYENLDKTTYNIICNDLDLDALQIKLRAVFEDIERECKK